MLLNIWTTLILLKCISINYASGLNSAEWQQYSSNGNLDSNHLTYGGQKQDLSSWASLSGGGWNGHISSEGRGWNIPQEQIHHTHTIPIGHHIEVLKPIAVPVYKHIGIPLAQPVGIPVTHVKAIGVPQPYPVHIPVAHPVPIPVIKTIATIVEKKVPYPVEKIIPVPIEKPVPIHIEKHIPVPVEKPYPVHVPIYKPILHRHRSHGWDR
ncbi:PREDICTED: proline-rich protein 2-like [Ceratosolen solmsi marchali]|uniref:Proline-rich protein 2-like n=1 Tax=Ceratosolen solmsi marchali TaxID=326594 RepID=A0AAJ6VL51_9HYME|nr:PREDICTED: proline-rich protein 2-like [Ceratosolen solmsi marchali]